MKSKAKYLFFVLMFLTSFALDQGSKIWARNNLKPEGYPFLRRETKIPVKAVIPGFFEMRYSENPGSAFGLFRSVGGARNLLTVVGVFCLAVIGFWLYRAPAQASWLAAKLGLLAGGAIGNIFDRIRFGRVTDFIVWKITRAGEVITFTVPGLHWLVRLEWPTFNIADAALVIGVIAILLDRPRDNLPPETVSEPSKKAAT